jgi:hypothetical protein
MIKYLVYPDYYEYDGDGHYYHTSGGYKPVAALDSLEEVSKLIKKLTLEDLMNIGEDRKVAAGTAIRKTDRYTSDQYYPPAQEHQEFY